MILAYSTEKKTLDEKENILISMKKIVLQRFEDSYRLVMLKEANRAERKFDFRTNIGKMNSLTEFDGI